ncbi:TPR [Nesidiocoris tenuis]|uniref:TPR n=2 Tax=Nesidiocoris tenuis TaxID=355587 RepID=A0ABN7AHT3_9HEMI|nr:TPR [Nesidiocoris tenuis]
MQKNELISYRKLSQYYRQKKFKKGLIIADKLLENPESPLFSKCLAWKGLFRGYLYSPGKGLKIVHEALKEDEKSAFIWQALGKLYAMQGTFRNAVKCYERGLELEPENVGIMENLAQVLVHVDDLEGFVNRTGDIVRTSWSSRRILAKNHWIWYSVALHMAGDLQGALSIFNSLSQSWTADRKESTYKSSELLLYHNQLIRETGDSAKALRHILENRHLISDVQSVEEVLVDLYAESDQFEDAMAACRSLIERNPNNKSYYEKLFELKANVSEAGAIENLIEDLPHVKMPKTLLLQYASGKIFLQFLKELMSEQLKKGSFSLFESVKSILGDSHKKNCVMSYLKKHEQHLASSNCRSVDQTEKELISNYVCTAKILDSDKQYEQALRLVKKALVLNPLMPDSYLTKAKILKHAMNPTEACKAVERAQRMDPTDWYMGVKLVRYMLRANIIDRAEEMYTELRQNDGTEETDVPCLWFLFEKALALERIGKLEESLMTCEMVENAFVKIESNAFPMHSLCLKKLTLRSYESFVTSLRNLRKNEHYRKTAILAVKLAVKLHDDRKKQVKSQTLNKSLRRTPSSIGKSQSTISSMSRTSVRVQPTPVQTEPVRIENPLVFVKKFLKALQLHHADSIDTHLAAYEVNSRLKKPILMIKSLLEAKNVQEDHPALLVSKIRCQNIMKQWASEGNQTKQHLTVHAQLGAKILWKEKSAEETIWTLLQEEKDLQRLLDVGKALYHWDKAKKDTAIRWVNIDLQHCTYTKYWRNWQSKQA